MKRVAVIGLDGISWDILNNLFAWKAMPNLERLVTHSKKGILPSTIPPESGPAWTSIATGVNPGKHGVFGFTRPTKKFEDIRILNSRDVKYLRIHEMLAINGLKSVCVNQLLTYPIEKIQGSYVITDWLSPKIHYSPEIKQFAENYCGPTLGRASPILQKNWEAEYHELSTRVDTINNIIRNFDWDLFWAIYSEPDHLFHRYYDMVMKNDKAIFRLFRKMDETFGIIQNHSDLLFVVSDHGFRKFRYGVYINSTLEKLGLVERVPHRMIRDLACQRQVEPPKSQFNLPKNLYRFLSKLPSSLEFVLLKIYKRLLKANVKAKITTHVNPKSSKAFAHGFGIYTKEKELVDQILSMLKGKPFIGGIWRKEELYQGRQLEAMPDLIIVPNFDGGFSFRGDVIAPKTVIRRDFSGHHPDGIIIINGDGLQPSWMEGIKPYDIVPTILNFLGLDIPEDTDGEVIDLRRLSS